MQSCTNDTTFCPIILHEVCMVACGHISMSHLRSKFNVSDILSKHGGYQNSYDLRTLETNISSYWQNLMRRSLNVISLLFYSTIIFSVTFLKFDDDSTRREVPFCRTISHKKMIDDFALHNSNIIYIYILSRPFI